MKKALIIFVRKPELGKVKTRLAASVGNEKTLLIYKELLQHTFEISAAVDADKYVFYTDEIETNDLWNAKRFIKRVQYAGNLGSKMKNAFEELLNAEYEKAIIIGSDCLELTTDIITNAFRLLENNDVVIGPALDGGYYLLGMKKMLPFLFENKEWSTDSVYRDAIIDLEKKHLYFHSLQVLRDVDTEEDWLASKK